MDVGKLLGKKVEEARREPRLPRGMWKLLITGFKPITSSKKQTPGIEFAFRILEPGPDVDPTELSIYKDEMKAGGYELERKNVKETFYLSQDEAKVGYSLVMLREFLEATGVSIAGRTFEECLPDCQGAQLWGTSYWEPIEGRPGEFFEKFGKFAAI